jgi:hypothetical protein
MLQNSRSRRNNKSFRWGRDAVNGPTGPEGAAKPSDMLTVRLSGGIPANILDFRAPQKHVLVARPVGTGRKAGCCEGPDHLSQQARKRPVENSGKRGNEFEIRNSAGGQSDTGKGARGKA